MTNKEYLNALKIDEYAEEICKLKDLSNEEIKEWLQAKREKTFTDEEKEFARLLLKFTDFKYITRNADALYLTNTTMRKDDIAIRDFDFSYLKYDKTMFCFRDIKNEDERATSLEEIANS